jgi:hypothetical protein
MPSYLRVYAIAALSLLSTITPSDNDEIDGRSTPHVLGFLQKTPRRSSNRAGAQSLRRQSHSYADYGHAGCLMISMWGMPQRKSGESSKMV